MSTTYSDPAARWRRSIRRAARPRPQRKLGLITILGGAAGNQTGAAIATQAFTGLGPAGVVGIRQLVAAAVLLPVARPRLRQLTWRQWWPCLLLAVVFATMNLALYSAMDRIGLGLAVTLEFLGPLVVALVGSRGRHDVAIGGIAAVGVYVLVLPGPSSDLLGIGLGLLAAACWATYIVTNRVAGQRLPGLQAPAVGSLLAALLYLPVLIGLGIDGRLAAGPVILSVAAGILSSAVPYAADVTALRFVPQRTFAIVMSVNPVLAALAGWLLLAQTLDPHEWVGVAIVVGANVAATVGRSRLG